MADEPPAMDTNPDGLDNHILSTTRAKRRHSGVDDTYKPAKASKSDSDSHASAGGLRKELDTAQVSLTKKEQELVDIRKLVQEREKTIDEKNKKIEEQESQYTKQARVVENLRAEASSQQASLVATTTRYMKIITDMETNYRKQRNGTAFLETQQAISGLLMERGQWTEEIAELTEEIAELKKRLKFLEHEPEQDGKEGTDEDLHDKVRALRNKVALLEEEQTPSSDTSPAKEQVEELSRKVRSLEDLQVKQKDFADLKDRELERLVKDLAKSRDEAEGLAGAHRDIVEKLEGQSVEAVMETIRQSQTRITELEAKMKQPQPQEEEPGTTEKHEREMAACKRDYEQQIKSLSSSITSLQGRYSEQERVHKVKIDTLQTKLNGVPEMTQTLQAQNTELEELVTQRDVQIAQQTERLGTLDSLQVQHSELRTKLQELNNDLEEKKTRITELESVQTQNAAVLGDRTVVEAAEKIVELENDLRQADADAIRIKTESKSLSTRKNELEADVKAKTLLLDQQKTDLEDLQKQINSATVGGKSLAEALRDIDDYQERLLQLNTNAEQKHEQVAKDKAALEATCVELAKELEHERGRLSILEEQFDGASEALEGKSASEVAEDLKAYRERIAKLGADARQERERVANEKATFEAKCTELTNELEHTKKQHSDASKVAEALKASQERIAKLEADARQEHERVANEKATFEAKCTELTNELEHAKKQHSDASKVAEALKASQERIAKLEADARQEHERVAIEKAAFEAECTDLTKELERVKKEHSDASKVAEDLKASQEHIAKLEADAQQEQKRTAMDKVNHRARFEYAHADASVEATLEAKQTELTKELEQERGRLVEFEKTETMNAAQLDGKTVEQAVQRIIELEAQARDADAKSTEERSQAQAASLRTRISNLEREVTEKSTTIDSQMTKLQEFERDDRSRAAALNRKTIYSLLNDVRIQQQTIDSAQNAAKIQKVYSLTFSFTFKLLLTRSLGKIQEHGEELQGAQGIHYFAPNDNILIYEYDKTNFEQETTSRLEATSANERATLDLKVAQDQKARLGEQVQRLQNDLDKKAQEHESAIAQKSGEITTLTQQLANLENDSDKKFQEHESTIAQKSGEITTLTQQLANLESKNKTDTAELNKRLEEANGTISRLKGKGPEEPTASTSEVERLRRELEEIKTELEKAKSRQTTADSSAEVEKLRRELEAAKKGVGLQNPAVDELLRLSYSRGHHLKKLNSATIEEELREMESTRPRFKAGDAIPAPKPGQQQDKNDTGYDADGEHDPTPDGDGSLNLGEESDRSVTYERYRTMAPADHTNDTRDDFKHRINVSKIFDPPTETTAQLTVQRIQKVFREAAMECLQADHIGLLFLAPPVPQERLQLFSKDAEKHGPKVHNSYLDKAGKTTTEELRKSGWNLALQLKLVDLLTSLVTNCPDKAQFGPEPEKLDWKALVRDRFNTIYELAIKVIPKGEAEKNDHSLVLQRLIASDCARNIKNGQTGFRTAVTTPLSFATLSSRAEEFRTQKYNGRIQISIKMLCYSQERKDEHGITVWKYAYDVTEALGVNGMSDEEVDEE
ncbi:hypothetical protein V5O48_016966, partial [Marasmius crinis-equi]